MKKAVAIISGGLDSVVTAHLARREVDELYLISFDYGQRHRKELEHAELHAWVLKTKHFIFPLSLYLLMTNNALTNPQLEVPEGHYVEPSMRLTVVPNRNSIMLNIAAALVIDQKAEALYTGVHAGDHSVYPDCRPEFIVALEHLLLVANEGFISKNFKVIAPFLNKSKAEIVRKGKALGVNFHQTWSCYQGGEVQCGRCSACVERKELF